MRDEARRGVPLRLRDMNGTLPTLGACHPSRADAALRRNLAAPGEPPGLNGRHRAREREVSSQSVRGESANVPTAPRRPCRFLLDETCHFRGACRCR